MAPAISKPLLSDLVAQTAGQLPSSHPIRPVGDRPDLANVDDNESGAGIPLIDFKKLNGPERPKVVEAIGRACESEGFFMVTNYGIPAEVVEGMLRVAREFFHLPESERLKCYSDDPKKAIRLSTSFNVRTEKDAMKVLIAMIAANSAINIALVVNMKDITSSWETQWEVLYAIFMMFSVLSTVTSIFTAVSPADSRARRFSAFCVRLGLLLATALFFVSITCQLGHSGCIAGVPTAAVLVIFLAVLWWKYC